MKKRPILLTCTTVFLALGLQTASAEIVNRWSFNDAAGNAVSGTTFTDAISGAVATVKGNGATLSGSALVLPGTTSGEVADDAISAYVDLPNGLISSKTNLTVEIWATPISFKDSQRLFDFGNMAVGDGLGAPGEWTGATAPSASQSSDDLMLAINRDTTINTQRMAMRLDGQTEQTVDTSLSTTVNTQYHYVLTFQDGVGSFGASGGRVTWYRNGSQAGTKDVNFHLSNIEDVNNWLGRSQFSTNSNSNVSYDEVRIYDHALSAAEITASRTAGQNVAAPVAQPDTASIHVSQKVLLPVLTNDTGTIFSGTVTIVQPPQFGTATPDSSGRILYVNTNGAVTSDSFTYRVSGPGGVSAAATVTIQIADVLRIPTVGLNVPGAPPPTNFSFVDAFPGLTFSRPVCMASVPGNTKQLFVLEQELGRVQLVPDVTASPATKVVYLNLSSVLTARGESLKTNTNSHEPGLLSIAVHPNYAQNGYIYLFYSVNKSGSMYQRISRFTRSIGNPNAADPASEQILIEQRDENDNHQGSGMQFGPDGYLYISVGDEGGGNDQFDNSQRINKDFFSAVMRIDVDKKPGSLNPNTHASVPRDGGIARYAIPPDNPYVGATSFNGLAVTPSSVRTEFWAVGFRNPWRMFFDPPTGELWLGDVGQNAGTSYEEINLVIKGGNYGWSFMHGTSTNTQSNSTAPRPSNFTQIAPLHFYQTSSDSDKGRAIVGGVVYRGSRFSNLIGAYVFADNVSGNVWTLRRNQSGPPTVTRITGEGGGSVASFALDPSNGDVLSADLVNGRIRRLISSTVTTSFPQTLSATNLFADLTDLSPNPGILPYTPNLPFWSDHAVKRRWFAIPTAADKMTWARDANWTFPTGGIWVKHFDMEMTRGNPETKKRIETRLLVKTATGAYGVSYRWNEAQTEANLVADEGASFPLTITENSVQRIQTWLSPSRASCLTCHTAPGGHILSFTSRQLNRDESINGFAGNQLTTLAAGGYFSNTPESPDLLPRHVRPDETTFPLETRVRSYLAVNCAYCHMQGGTALAAWDGRPQLTLAETRLIYGPVTNNGGNPKNKLIVPGYTARSVILSRMEASNGFSRMPPLATSELDHSNNILVRNWITQMSGSYDNWRQTIFGSTTSDEGTSDANPDGDQGTNQSEFVTGTNPLDSSSYFQPSISFGGGNTTLSFDLPANRAFDVQTSTDLVNWTLWDVPGGSSLAWPGGTVTISGPTGDPARFFRVRASAE